MTAPELSTVDKNVLRIQCLAKRQRVTSPAAKAASNAVATQVSELVREGAIVAGYLAVRGELDLTETMTRLYHRGHSLCLPVIEASEKPLYFRRWRPGDVMERGRYGIDTPPAGAPVFRPDVLLVPLIAFDRSGHRLGYGAGYYDRTITQLRIFNPGLMVMGIGYAVQEVPAIPSEKHDAKMNLIVTEKEVVAL